MADISKRVRVVVVQTTLLLLCMLVASAYGRQVLVDLTHEFGEDTPVWPGNPQLNLSNLVTVELEDIKFVTNWYGAPEHLGTHLDAPAHFFPNKSHASEIPLSKLIGPGVVIDVSAKVAANLDYQVTVDDITQWEATHGRIPDGAIVVMNANWSSRWPDPDLIFGAVNATMGNMHFPSFHADTAAWLVANRRVSVVGVDTPSLDFGPTERIRPVHQTLLRAGIPLAENLANLHLLPPSGATLYLPVYKLKNGSGGPLRAFAIYDVDDDATNSGHVTFSVGLPTVFMCLFAWTLKV